MNRVEARRRKRSSEENSPWLFTFSRGTAGVAMVLVRGGGCKVKGKATESQALLPTEGKGSLCTG